MAQTTEAPATDTKPTEAPVSAPPARDDELNAFFDLLDKVGTEEFDHSTDEAQAEITAKYTAISGNRKALNAAKNAVSARMQEAVLEANLDKARAFLDVQKVIDSVSTAKVSAPKEPVDPTPGFKDGYVTLMLAAQIYSNNPPKGVTDAAAAISQADATLDELQEDVMKVVEYLSGTDENAELPEVNPLVAAALKVAQGKAVKVGRKPSTSTASRAAAYSGPRRSISLHIAQVMDQHPDEDFLSVTELAKGESSGEGDTPGYGAGEASSGAIAAKIDSCLKTGAEIAEGLYATLEPKKGVTRTKP